MKTMQTALFVLTLIILIFSLFTKTTKKGAPFIALLRLMQVAGIAKNTSPGPR